MRTFTTSTTLLIAALLVATSMAEPHAAEYKDAPSKGDAYGGDVADYKDTPSKDYSYGKDADYKESAYPDAAYGGDDVADYKESDYPDKYGGGKKPCPPKGGADVSTYGDSKDDYGKTQYPEGSYPVKDDYPEGEYPVKDDYPEGEYPVKDYYPEGDYPVKDYYPEGDYPVKDYYPEGDYPEKDYYPEGDYPAQITDDVYGKPSAYRPGGAGGRPHRRGPRGGNRRFRCDIKQRRLRRLRRKNRQLRRRLRREGAKDYHESDGKADYKDTAYPTKPADVDNSYQQPSTAYPEEGGAQPVHYNDVDDYKSAY